MWDGRWYRLGNVAYHECCDCSLVHRVDHKLECGTIYERWCVDKRETNKARRARKKAK